MAKPRIEAMEFEKDDGTESRHEQKNAKNTE
jgi:hypothetical protein